MKVLESEIVKLHRKNGLIEQYAANAVAAITGGPAAVSAPVSNSINSNSSSYSATYVAPPVIHVAPAPSYVAPPVIDTPEEPYVEVQEEDVQVTDFGRYVPPPKAKKPTPATAPRYYSERYKSLSSC